jgi:hypothetical protein
MPFYKKTLVTRCLWLLIIILLQLNQSSGNNLKPLFYKTGEMLIFTPDSSGNKFPDFSWCGYMQSASSIPDIPVRAFVPCYQGKDMTHTIQRAIDYVSSLPADVNNFRGTVLLDTGIFTIYGQIHISTSGIIIRGSGFTGKHPTILLAAGDDRRTLIEIEGIDNRVYKNKFEVVDMYVPVGSNKICVEKGHSLKTGDTIEIVRTSGKEWINLLSMNEFGGETSWLGWKPGERDIHWERIITQVTGDTVFIDIPITTALDRNMGGAYVVKFSWPGRIVNAGIENLRCVSEYNAENKKDENHSWTAVSFNHIGNAWARQMVIENFSGSAVLILPGGSNITVEDCISLNPVSEIGGARRNIFYNAGQKNLFLRCFSEYGIHDFAVGFVAAGPNAFVQCGSNNSFGFSGPVDSWASGVLFDLVDIEGNILSLDNIGPENHGAGWCAANSVLWNCSASKIICKSPPGAYNWAIGTWGQFEGNGIWHETNNHVSIGSLFYKQLEQRLNRKVWDSSFLLPFNNFSTSNPTIEMAQQLTVNSNISAVTLKDFILNAGQRNKISTAYDKNKTVSFAYAENKDLNTTTAKEFKIFNGWLVADKLVVTGKIHSVEWWRGDSRPYAVKKSAPHITRFVPGYKGTGYTDIIDSVVTWLKMNKYAALEHNYGLWYDRRRDDHQRTCRMDGNVWLPFYELPFARSGQGTAWDGLSKYDLTKYNPWYWSRLKSFADQAGNQGLLLLHQNYFQHNILEAGAHWADFPWRTINNINNTGFPEPPFYAGGKRIFMAGQFYDINQPVRKELHRAYIRKCLETFKNNSNVIQLTSAEYTGPLHFVQFWIDVIKEWEQETGCNAFIGLSTTKDVQDAILDDPERSVAVDIIDIRYWHYRSDGTLYSPMGGQNLAPRQFARIMKPGQSSFEQVYRAVIEYRTKYPGKAVIYSSVNNITCAWAVFMAGGSLACIPKISDQRFYEDAAYMKPVKSQTGNHNNYLLASKEKGIIVYFSDLKKTNIDLSDFSGTFILSWINAENGEILPVKYKRLKGGQIMSLEPPDNEHIIAWIRKV